MNATAGPAKGPAGADSTILTALQAALAAALANNNEESQASQQHNEQVINRLRSVLIMLLDGRTRVVGDELVKLVDFVMDNLPAVFCATTTTATTSATEGAGGAQSAATAVDVDAGVTQQLLRLLLTTARTSRSLMPRVVCLVAKLAELPPAPEQRRTLALELGAGAMELLLDAEQQLLLLSLPPPATGSAGRAAEGAGTASSTPEPAALGLGPCVGAFEVLLARLHERQQQHKANQAAAADGAEQADASSMPTLTAAIATPQECLAAAEAGACLLAQLLVLRPTLLAPRVPQLVCQALLQLAVAAEPGPQASCLACAARLVALCGPPHAQAGCGEALLHVALCLLEAWCDGALSLEPTSTSSNSGKRAAAAAALAAAWHGAVGQALEACVGQLRAAGLLDSYANRLLGLLLRVCTSLAAKAAGPVQPGGLACRTTSTPAAATAAAAAAAALECYLPRLHDCLASCPHLLPSAMEKGVLDLLLQLLHLQQQQQPGVGTAQGSGGAGKGQAAKEAVSEPGRGPVLAAALHGCCMLCVQWLGQQPAAGCLAAAVRVHLGLPPAHLPSPTEHGNRQQKEKQQQQQHTNRPQRVGPAQGAAAGPGGAAAEGEAGGVLSQGADGGRPSKKRRLQLKHSQMTFADIGETLTQAAGGRKRAGAGGGRDADGDAEDGDPNGDADGGAVDGGAAAASGRTPASGRSGGGGGGGGGAASAAGATGWAAVAANGAAAAWVRLVAGLAAPPADRSRGSDGGGGGGGEDVGEALAGAVTAAATQLSKLQLVTCHLLPAGSAECTLLTLSMAAGWAGWLTSPDSQYQQLHGRQGQGPRQEEQQQQADERAVLRRARCAAFQALCVAQLAALRQSALDGCGGGGCGDGDAEGAGGRGATDGGVAAGSAAALLRILRAVELLSLGVLSDVEDTMADASIPAAADVSGAAAPTPPHVAAEAAALSVLSVATLLPADCTAGIRGLTIDVHTVGQHQQQQHHQQQHTIRSHHPAAPPLFQDLLQRASSACAQLPVVVPEAGGDGDGGGAAAAAAALAACRGAVCRVLPLAMLVHLMELEAGPSGAEAGEQGGGVDASDRVLVAKEGWQEDVQMVLSELGTAQAALGLVEPAVEGAGGGGSGAAAASAALVRHQHEVAAIADAMCALAALCSCRRPGQVVAVTVETIVQVVHNARAVLTCSCEPPIPDKPAKGAAAALKPAPGPAAAAAASAAASLLPDLPHHLWVAPLQPVLASTAAAAAAANTHEEQRLRHMQQHGAHGGAAGAAATQPLLLQGRGKEGLAWPGLAGLLEFLEPWMACAAEGAGSGGAGPSAPGVLAGLQLSALAVLKAFVSRCPASSLPGCRSALRSALDRGLQARHAATRRGGAALLQAVVARPAVLVEAFGDPGAPVNPQHLDAAEGQLLLSLRLGPTDGASQAEGCVGGAEGSGGVSQGPLKAVRCSLVAAAAGLAGPGGLAGRESCVVLPVLVLRCLGDDDLGLRAAATSALDCLTDALGVTLEGLLLTGPHAPKLLEFVGRSVADLPYLLPELSRLLRQPEGHLVYTLLPHAIGPLCCGEMMREMEALATRLSCPPADLFNFASEHAFAHAFYHISLFETFLTFVDKLMVDSGPDGCVTALRSQGRNVAKQIVLIAGSQPPDAADAGAAVGVGADATAATAGTAGTAVLLDRLAPPPATVTRITTFLSAVAKEMHDLAHSADPVQELLVGQTAAALFEAYGKALCLQGQAQGDGGAGGGGGSGGRALSRSAREAEALKALRSLGVFIELLTRSSSGAGPDGGAPPHRASDGGGGDNGVLAGHAPPVMVLLTAAVQMATAPSASLELKMQSVAAWRVFLRNLAAVAPALLERVAVQAAVVLLPLLESSHREVSAAAAEVLTHLVVENKKTVRKALVRMPPLPSAALARGGLERVWHVLRQELRLDDKRRKLQQLADSLTHDSMAVRRLAVDELRLVLSSQRDFVAKLIDSAMNGRAAAAANGNSNTSNANAAGGGSSNTQVTASQKVGSKRTAATAAAAAAAAAGGGVGGGGGPADAELVSKLLTALLRCCEDAMRTPVGRALRESCGECLGLLGALDPARVSPARRAPPDLVDPELEAARRATKGGAAGAAGTEAGGRYALALALVQDHLVRIMETTSQLLVYRHVSYALQCLLQHYNGSEGGAGEAPAAEAEGLYWQVQQDIRPLVKPYLSTRYTLEDTNRNNRVPEGDPLSGPPLFSGCPRPSFRGWLQQWIKGMIRYTSGPHQAAFFAVSGVLRFDLPLMTFLLPQVLHSVLVGGIESATAAIQREVLAVLQAGACPEFGDGALVHELELFLQTLFGLLDVLGRWVKDASQVAGALGSAQESTHSELSRRIKRVADFVASIPRETLARAALRCGAHARAVQYFETFMRERAAAGGGGGAKRGSGGNPVPCSGGLNPSAEITRPSYDSAHVSFLLEAYGQLEEPDGLVGLCAMRPGGLSKADQVLVAERAGQWSDAISLHEAAMRREEEEGPGGGGVAAAALGALKGSGSGDGGGAASVAGAGGGAGCAPAAAAAGALGGSHAGFLRCMLSMGHLQGVLSAVDGLLSRGRDGPVGRLQLAAFGVAAAWRLGRWGLLARYLQLAEAAEVEAAAAGAGAAAGGGGGGGAGAWALGPGEKWELDLGSLLSTLQHGSWSAVRSLLTANRMDTLAVLPALAQESYVRAYPHMARLHMMQEVSDVLQRLETGGGGGGGGAGGSARGAKAEQEARRQRWESVQNSLSTLEPLQALRRQLSAIAGDREQEAEAWLAAAKLFRGNGHLEAAQGAVLEASSRGVCGAALEAAKLLRARELHHRAATELQTAIAKFLGTHPDVGGGPLADEASRAAVRHVARLRLCLARWSAAQGGSAPGELQRLFREGLEADRSWDKPHFHFARYLDTLYQDAKRRQTGAGAKPAGPGGKNPADRMLGRAKILLGEERQYYEILPDVITQYGEALRKGVKHVMQAVPRVLTLYCEHGSDQLARQAARVGGGGAQRSSRETKANNDVRDEMRRLAADLPPEKWLGAAPQLISRIAHPHGEVAEVIRQVLVRLTQAYSDHMLWSCAAVTRSANAHRRSLAAEMLRSVRQGCGKDRAGAELRGRIEAFAALADQLIRLCHWQPPPARGSARTPTEASVATEFAALLRALPVDIMVPTQEQFRVRIPPAAPSRGALADHPGAGADRAHLVTVAGIQDRLVIMQSLQKPKKLTLTGSDGAPYSFLAKPKDDLRKDYRLMDFAGMLNALFNGGAASRRRGLRLRTYAVIPLSDDCGVLQWVEGLMPIKAAIEDTYLAEGLLGAGSASRREWQMWIKKLWDTWPEPTNKAKLLSRVLEKLPPRLHRWLLTRYPEPATWLQARLNFTRTNAVWCMVGHVLGLGDRHGENILLDTANGDTVHVDFGCLFDKGLTLEVPEMVPFRLTQNVVDCFGISGVEGVFRKSAEITLQVLRQHRDALMTCAETFLHDPLVEWVADRGRKGAGAQDSGGSGAGGGEVENPAAKDALCTIEGRLGGTLLGVQSVPTLPLSCEGQAARLIEEATDRENLGRMYVWWMAWY